MTAPTSKAPVRPSRTVGNRRSSPRAPGLTASTRRIDLAKRTDKRINRPAAEWQAEAWSYFDEVPEVKYAVRNAGNAMAKLRLFIAWDDPADSREPTPIFDDAGDMIDAADGLTDALAQAAVSELARLDRYSPGGIPALLQRMNLQFEIPGECFFVGRAARDDDPERWEIRSIDEVIEQNGVVYLRDDDTTATHLMTALDPELDTIIRLWIEHPRFAVRADSWMRSALTDCRALMGLSNEIIAETNSQASAGVLLVPTEVDEGPADVTDDDETERNDVFMDDLAAALVDPIIDPDSPSSVAPIVIRGPAEALKELRHIHLGRDRGESLDRRIESRVRRLARGANLPVEVIEGHMSTTFANAEQIDQDKWDDHYEPRAWLITSMLTIAFLRPNLIDLGFAPDVVDRVRVSGDGSALIREPNVEANAKDAHGALAISDSAYRKAIGFDETAAPDDDELARRIGQASATRPDASFAQRFARPEPAAPPPAPPVVVAAAAKPVEDVGRRLTDIDRDLRRRLAAAADVAVLHAEAKIGAQLRTSAKIRDAVPPMPQVPHRDVARTAGAAAIEAAGFDIDKMLTSAFDVVAEQTRTWGRAAAADTLDAIGTVAAVSDPDREIAAETFNRQIDEAADWFANELRRFTAERVQSSQPDAVTAAAGETDPTAVVPHGLIRQAVAVAGGQAEFSDEGGAYVVVARSGRPTGGIATGNLARQTLVNGGASIERFRWVYGPASRANEFPPHKRLDGVEFDNFDDPRLRVRGNFPPRSHYLPGDHAGCVCDFELVIAAARPSATPQQITAEQYRTGGDTPTGRGVAALRQTGYGGLPTLTDSLSDVVDASPLGRLWHATGDRDGFATDTGVDVWSDGPFGVGAYTLEGTKAGFVKSLPADVRDAVSAGDVSVAGLALRPEAKLLVTDTDGLAVLTDRTGIADPMIAAAAEGWDAVQVMPGGDVVVLNRAAVYVEQ